MQSMKKAKLRGQKYLTTFRPTLDLITICISSLKNFDCHCRKAPVYSTSSRLCFQRCIMKTSTRLWLVIVGRVTTQQSLKTSSNKIAEIQEILIWGICRLNQEGSRGKEQQAKRLLWRTKKCQTFKDNLVCKVEAQVLINRYWGVRVTRIHMALILTISKITKIERLVYQVYHI